MEWMRFDISVEHELHSKRRVTINVISAFCSEKTGVNLKTFSVFLSTLDTQGSRLWCNTARDIKVDTIFRAIPHKLLVVAGNT